MVPTEKDSYTALVVEHLSQDFSGVALRQFPMPVPGPGQLLIRVRAAALNFPDVLLTQGNYQFKPQLPFVPGLEASGEVLMVGSGIENFRSGDAVVVQTKQGGALASMVVSDVSDVRRMPQNLDWAEAAAHSVAAITAYVSLIDRGRLEPGETLLVHGASGGAGLAAVQLGRHLGARVVGTGRSLEKLEVAREAGAHEVLQVGPGLRDEILRITSGNGVDVVFDTVGGDVFDASIRSLAWGGRLLVIGFLGGRIADIKSNYLLIKNIAVMGVRAGEFVRRDPVKGGQALHYLDELAAQGVLKPLVSARFSLEESVVALRLMAAGGVPGKIVVTM